MRLLSSTLHASGLRPISMGESAAPAANSSSLSRGRCCSDDVMRLALEAAKSALRPFKTCELGTSFVRRRNPDEHFPCDMCGTNDQISVRGVPCALGRYFHQHSGESALRVLTPYACEAGFLDWVAGPRQKSPDLEIDELIMCPMLWCRKSFKSISATVDHVKTCPRLRDGWYWCPFCRRPERFLECDKSCEVHRQPMIRRKSSKLCRAASFFNRFGRRNSAKEVFKDKANPETERQMWRGFEGEAQDAGLDDQLLALNIAGIHEMCDSSAYGFPDFLGASFASAFWDGTNAMPEMCDLSNPEPSIELPGSRMTFASPPRIERGSVLAESDFHRCFHSADTESNSTTASKALARATFPVGVNEPGKGYDATSLQWIGSPVSDPVSPVSPTENLTARWSLSSPPDPLLIPKHLELKRDNEPLIALSTSNIVSSSSNVRSSHAFSLSSAEQWSSDLTHTNENIINDDPSHASCDGPWNLHSGSTWTQVEELRDLVKVVNNEWMQRLTLAPDLHRRCAAVSSRELFAEGLKSLEQCLCYNVSRDFVEIFALMHVAFAAAYILHRDDSSYCWSTFFQDALNWKLSLSGQDDQAAFSGVMDLWWQPELSFDTSLTTNVDPALGYVEIQQDLADGYTMRVMDMLRNGKIIRNCVEFLNGYKEMAIIERNSQFLPGAMVSNAQNRACIVEHMIETIIQPLQHHRNIEHMIKTITQPLRKRRGIEAFRDQVIDVENQLRNGLLQNPRDVEVSLLLSGKRISKSLLIYDKYCDMVATLCDNAMKPYNPSWNEETSLLCDDSRHDFWRNHSYVTELQEVLAVSLELDRCQGISSSTNHWPNASVLAVIRPNATSSVSPTSPTSSTIFTSTNSSPTSLASWTLTSASEDDTVGGLLASPTNTPISPMSPSFPIPNSETTHCSSCGATFTGTPQHRRSNLKRHMRTSRRHSGPAALKCPESGCKSTLMRTDNLAKHLQSQHGISRSSDRQDTIKRSNRVTNWDFLSMLENSRTN